MKLEHGVYIPTVEDEDKKQIDIPSGTTEILGGSFHNFVRLNSIILPDTLTFIGESAFSGCYALKSVIIPPKVSVLQEKSFENCRLLNEILFNNGLKKINKEAFLNCSSLIELDFPKNLKIIEQNAFRGCSNITQIILPKKLDSIHSGAFSNCTGLTSIEIPNRIKNIEQETFSNCQNLKKVVLPQKINFIGIRAFKDCSELREINIPKGIISIEQQAFSNCISLARIVLPENLTFLSAGVFEDCISLLDVVLPTDLETVGKGAFKGCYSLKELHLPYNVSSIKEEAFKNCVSLEYLNIPMWVNKIEKGLFSGCQSLKRLDLPAYIKEIQDEAFKNCKSIERLEIPFRVNKIGNNVFDGCLFKYIYKLKNERNVIFAKKLPENTKNLDVIINLQDIKKHMKKCIPNFDVSVLAVSMNINSYMHLFKILEKTNMFLPNFFVRSLLKEIDERDFINKFTFKFFKAEMKDYYKIDDVFNNDYAYSTFLRFASSIGCFSKENIKDKQGNKTESILGQKASSFLAGIMHKNKFSLDELSFIFENIPLDIDPSQEFLSFISKKDENGNYNNFNSLIALEEKYNGIFVKTLISFDEIKNMRVSIDNNGKTHKLSWKDAIIKYYNVVRYDNITRDSAHIADVFMKKGMDQENFDEAKELFKQAKRLGVKKHILGYPLKENDIIKEIEDIKNDTLKDIQESTTLLEKLYQKKFTYEMLDKSAPENAIIGVYCNCCATIGSMFYGKEIAESTITSNDVQNIIIREIAPLINGDDEISPVAKGAMYVNKEYGYIVINEFELNEKYKKHETSTGYYNDKKYPKEAKDRQIIFNTFMKGLMTFIENYDKLNPSCPIKQVNIGMGYNKLKHQCDKFKKQPGDGLYVPEAFGFEDVLDEQRILYLRKEDNKKFINKGEIENGNDRRTKDFGGIDNAT